MMGQLDISLAGAWEDIQSWSQDKCGMERVMSAGFRVCGRDLDHVKGGVRSWTFRQLQ